MVDIKIIACLAILALVPCLAQNYEPEHHHDDPCRSDHHGHHHNKGWASWSAWSVCSRDCGRGYQSRTRTCCSDKASYCKGSTSATKSCYHHCDIEEPRDPWDDDKEEPRYPEDDQPWDEDYKVVSGDLPIWSWVVMGLGVAAAGVFGVTVLICCCCCRARKQPVPSKPEKGLEIIIPGTPPPVYADNAGYNKALEAGFKPSDLPVVDVGAIPDTKDGIFP